MGIYSHYITEASEVLHEGKTYSYDEKLTKEYANYIKQNLLKLDFVKDVKLSDFKGCSLDINWSDSYNTQTINSNKFWKVFNDATKYFTKKYKDKDPDFSFGEKVVLDDKVLIYVDCYAAV